MAPTKAFSYVRFSRPEQAEGASLDRQLSDARRIADKHGWDLDTQLKDEGVSGFRGKNVESGALGNFIRMVEDGEIETGSILIFENFDRMSRLPTTEAFKLFSRLLDLGVSVYTVRNDRLHTKDTINSDLGSLLESIISMALANEESRKKSERLLHAWENKRSNAKIQKLTGKCPAWLTLSSDRQSFIVNEERAAVVRRIFEMMDNGLGAYRICQTLNAEGV